MGKLYNIYDCKEHEYVAHGVSLEETRDFVIALMKQIVKDDKKSYKHKNKRKIIREAVAAGYIKKDKGEEWFSEFDFRKHNKQCLAKVRSAKTVEELEYWLNDFDYALEKQA